MQSLLLSAIEVLVTTDENIRYQQNLSERKIAIAVLVRGLLPPIFSRVVAAVDILKPGRFIEIAMRINRASRAAKRN